MVGGDGQAYQGLAWGNGILFGVPLDVEIRKWLLPLALQVLDLLGQRGEVRLGLHDQQCLLDPRSHPHK